jgi:hypothetical protein
MSLAIPTTFHSMRPCEEVVEKAISRLIQSVFSAILLS